MIKKGWLVVLGLVVHAAPLAAETYQIDPMHSGVMFRVRHFGISTVTGRFDRFSGTVVYDKKNPKAWKAEAVIDAASVNTKIEKRDNHLRSAEFFDVAKSSEIIFRSTGVVEVKGNKAKLLGNLTMHGQTKPVALDLEIGGVMTDPKGTQHLGATATTKEFKRSSFGVNGGAGMVGDDVEIILEIEAVAAK